MERNMDLTVRDGPFEEILRVWVECSVVKTIWKGLWEARSGEMSVSSHQGGDTRVSRGSYSLTLSTY